MIPRIKYLEVPQMLHNQKAVGLAGFDTLVTLMTEVVWNSFRYVMKGYSRQNKDDFKITCSEAWSTGIQG